MGLTNKPSSDLDAEVLKGTNEYESVYANMCAIADWMTTAASIPDGYTKAHMAFMVRAIINYIRTVEFGKIIDANDRYLCEVPLADIRAFLYRNAGKLGISETSRINEIVEFFKEKIVKGGSETRYYAGVDDRTASYVERSGSFVVGKVTGDGICLSASFLQAYGMIIDFSALTGFEMMDAVFYITRMAVERSNIDMINRGLNTVRDQTMRIGREVMDRCVFWRQHFSDFDYKTVSSEIDRWVDEFKTRRQKLAGLDREIENMEIAGDRNDPEFMEKLNLAETQLQACIMAFDRVVDALFAYGNTLRDTANMHLLARPTDTVFDFDRILFDRLHLLSIDGLIGLFEKLLVGGGIANPQNCEGGFDPDITYGAFLQFPEPVRPKEKAFEVSYSGDYAESGISEFDDELEQKAKALAEEFADWIHSLPGKKGSISTFLKTLDSGRYRDALDLSIFDRVFISNPKDRDCGAWAGAERGVARLDDSRRIAFADVEDGADEHIEFVDYTYIAEEED